MKIEPLNIPAACAKGFELISINLDRKGFRIDYRSKDEIYWILRCEHMIAYKVVGKEISENKYLMSLPLEGTFFEILDSPWIAEFGPDKPGILERCKHYVLKFGNKIIEIIAQKFTFDECVEKSQINPAC